ncbi:MAG: hypothetical protein JWL65_3733, partial [Gammaproteobacteria bacterium]|nr:hypothetical protein [Gammaproteobacteria bacterium]
MRFVVSLIAIGVVALTASQASASDTTAGTSTPTAPSPDFTPDERAVLNRGFKWIDGRSDHGEKVFCHQEVALGPHISQPLCGTAEQLKNLAKLTIRGLREGHFDSFRSAQGVSGQRPVHNGSNRQLCGSGTPDVALTSCTRVIEDHREPPEVVGTARRNRAFLYQDNGNLAGAIEDYTKALELDFRDVKLNAKTYVNRGRAYVDSGDDSRALADYDKAIMLDPSL